MATEVKIAVVGARPISEARSPKSQPSILVSVQILRALAAIMVVLFHISHVGAGAANDQSVLNSGVDLFFLISGFIMVWITLRGDHDPIRFFKYRLARIAPLYWLATLAWLSVIVITGQMFPRLSEIILSMAFVPYFNHAGAPMPVLGLGWSLNYEMLFYLAFALTMFMRPMRQVAAIAVLFVGLVALRPVLGSTSGIGFRFTSPLFFEFIMGAAVAFTFPKFRQLPWYVGAGSIVVGIAALMVLAGQGLPRFIGQAGPHMFILIGALILEPFCRSAAMKPLKYLGDASYSLYLFHPFALALLPIVLPFTTASAVRRPILLVSAIIVGLLAHRFIERPLINIFRHQRRVPPQK